MLDAVTKMTSTDVYCLPKVELQGQGQSNSGKNMKTTGMHLMGTEDAADLDWKALSFTQIS